MIAGLKATARQRVQHWRPGERRSIKRKFNKRQRADNKDGARAALPSIGRETDLP